MKALPLLLAASIAANAALVATVALRPAAPADETATTAASPVAARPVAAAASGPRPQTKDIVASLNSAEPDNLHAVLTAAGVDPELIRTLVSSRIRQRYAARRSALWHEQYRPDEWWKSQGDYYSPERMEIRLRQKQITDEMNAEIERLLGPAPARGLSAWEQRRYGDLPPDKVRELRLIEQDYRELIGGINSEARDFRLPSDAEEINFLKEEQQRDLASILSPEELQAYQLRNSSTASSLRHTMTRMNATEQEFRLIHDLRREFDEAHSTSGPGDRDKAFWDARRQAEAALDEQLKATLGQQRFLDYKLAQDGGYRQLVGATERFGLPPDTPAKTYALRQDIPGEATRIAENQDLTPAQKKAAITRLAEQARDRVTALYGADLADHVLDTRGMRWIKQLEGGEIITYDETGKQTGRQRVKFE